MKYYTYCLFSPAREKGGRGGVEARYRRAPTGFVFHDDEARLEPGALRWPLRLLYDVIKQENDEDTVLPCRAILVRVDDHTIAATFSMSGFPVPHRWPNVYRTVNGVWASVEAPLYPLPLDEPNDDPLTAYLTGWLISDVRTLEAPEVEVSFGDLYDQCTQLVKLAGGCPCDLRNTGECVEFTVLPQLPEGFVGPMNTSYDVESKWLTRKRYRDLEGFEFVKPGHTIQGDFGKAVRPWDSHDFACVEERKEEFSKRGKQRSIDHAHRQNQCSKCVFTGKHWKTGEIQGCFAIRQCQTHVTEEEAWEYLEAKYQALGFEEMSGFTPAQRDYLIHMGHYRLRSTVITGNRHVDAYLSGFIRRGSEWAFLMAPASGRLDRTTYVSSYEELWKSCNSANLAAPDEIPEVPHITHRVRMAVAFMGLHSWAYVSGKGSRELYQCTWSYSVGGGVISRTGVNSGRYPQTDSTLEVSEGPSHWCDAARISALDVSQWVHSRKNKV